MKRLMLAAATVAMITPASASDLLKAGSWLAYAFGTKELASGIPMCGMQTILDREGPQSQLHLKYQQNVDHTYFQLYKTDWKFTDRTDVKVVFTFDKKRLEWNGIAKPKTDKTSSSFIEINIKGDDTKELLSMIGDAAQLTIEFPDGDEPQWVVSMSGSREVANAMSTCIGLIATGTSPIGKAAKPTTPIGTTPTGPAKPPVRRAVKDPDSTPSSR